MQGCDCSALSSWSFPLPVWWISLPNTCCFSLARQNSRENEFSFETSIKRKVTEGLRVRRRFSEKREERNHREEEITERSTQSYSISSPSERESYIWIQISSRMYLTSLYKSLFWIRKNLFDYLCYLRYLLPDDLFVIISIWSPPSMLVFRFD